MAVPRSGWENSSRRAGRVVWRGPSSGLGRPDPAGAADVQTGRQLLGGRERRRRGRGRRGRCRGRLPPRPGPGRPRCESQARSRVDRDHSRRRRAAPATRPPPGRLIAQRHPAPFYAHGFPRGTQNRGPQNHSTHPPCKADVRAGGVPSSLADRNGTPARFFPPPPLAPRPVALDRRLPPPGGERVRLEAGGPPERAARLALLASRWYARRSSSVRLE